MAIPAKVTKYLAALSALDHRRESNFMDSHFKCSCGCVKEKGPHMVVMLLYRCYYHVLCALYKHSHSIFSGVQHKSFRVIQHLDF